MWELVRNGRIMEEKIIVELFRKDGNVICDLEIPLHITAIELLQALNQSLHLGIRTEQIADCFLVAENPIALLRGNVELAEYGLHDGSRIFI